LTVHEPNAHNVYFAESTPLWTVIQRKQGTHLTAFFENNQKEKQRPLSLSTRTTSKGTVLPHGYEIKYLDYPKFYTYDKPNKIWIRRTKKGQKKSMTVGRMWWIPPRTGETFYLRLLLNYAFGPTSFEDIKQGAQTYQKACIELGILQSDKGTFLRSL
jgi:hypothetical protein